MTQQEKEDLKKLAAKWRGVADVWLKTRNQNAAHRAVAAELCSCATDLEKHLEDLEPEEEGLPF